MECLVGSIGDAHWDAESGFVLTPNKIFSSMFFLSRVQSCKVFLLFSHHTLSLYRKLHHIQYRWTRCCFVYWYTDHWNKICLSRTTHLDLTCLTLNFMETRFQLLSPTISSRQTPPECRLYLKLGWIKRYSTVEIKSPVAELWLHLLADVAPAHGRSPFQHWKISIKSNIWFTRIRLLRDLLIFHSQLCSYSQQNAALSVQSTGIISTEIY